MERKYCYGCMTEITEAVCPHCGWDTRNANLPHQLPMGTILANTYLVGRVLGQGGFGITYIGRDLNLDMVVAIKEFYPVAIVNRNTTFSRSVLLNTLNARGNYADNRDRFMREARTLAKLENVQEVVRVRSLFTENETAYIVMEYVRGQDLRHYVRSQGGKIHPEILMPLMEPVLRALNAVHQAGLIHRDVSPDNIMILPGGGVKLLDFGSVRVFDNPDADIDLSHSTEAILKHGFAPMEQYRSRGNLGPWTDEYGICASYYYCLTGKVPPEALARAMDDVDVDWDAVWGLTERQRAALRKGMSMRAKDRFGDLEALRKALYEQQQDILKPDVQPVRADVKPTNHIPEVTAVTLQKKKGKPRLAAAVLLLAAGIAAGTGWFLNREVPVPERENSPKESVSAVKEPVDTVIGSEKWYVNVLKKDPFTALGIKKAEIKRVIFGDSLENVPDYAIDLSADGINSVYGWVDNGVVTIVADNGINGQECSEKLFEGCYSLAVVDFNGAFYTDYAKNLSRMFSACRNLKTIDVSSWDLSNVENISYMFEGCESLTTIDVSKWDVSNVNDMSGLFSGCESLTAIDVSKWDVSAAIDMSLMFRNCRTLNGIDVGRWDVANVRRMQYMFNNCKSLRTVDVDDWNVERVQEVASMFYGCDDRLSPDISHWVMPEVYSYSRFMNTGALINGKPWESYF